MQAVPGSVERFADVMACQKLTGAEERLAHFFPRLVHKGDVDYVESIDLATFSLEALRKDGNGVDKNDLPAGDARW